MPKRPAKLRWKATGYISLCRRFTVHPLAGSWWLHEVAGKDDPYPYPTKAAAMVEAEKRSQRAKAK